MGFLRLAPLVLLLAALVQSLEANSSESDGTVSFFQELYNALPQKEVIDLYIQDAMKYLPTKKEAESYVEKAFSAFGDLVKEGKKFALRKVPDAKKLGVIVKGMLKSLPETASDLNIDWSELQKLFSDYEKVVMSNSVKMEEALKYRMKLHSESDPPLEKYVEVMKAFIKSYDDAKSDTYIRQLSEKLISLFSNFDESPFKSLVDAVKDKKLVELSLIGLSKLYMESVRVDFYYTMFKYGLLEKNLEEVNKFWEEQVKNLKQAILKFHQEKFPQDDGQSYSTAFENELGKILSMKSVQDPIPKSSWEDQVKG